METNSNVENSKITKQSKYYVRRTRLGGRKMRIKVRIVSLTTKTNFETQGEDELLQKVNALHIYIMRGLIDVSGPWFFFEFIRPIKTHIFGSTRVDMG